MAGRLKLSRAYRNTLFGAVTDRRAPSHGADCNVDDEFVGPALIVVGSFNHPVRRSGGGHPAMSRKATPRLLGPRKGNSLSFRQGCYSRPSERGRILHLSRRQAGVSALLQQCRPAGRSTQVYGRQRQTIMARVDGGLKVRNSKARHPGVRLIPASIRFRLSWPPK